MLNPLNIWRALQPLFERMDKVHLGLIAAGVAFYAMFAVFPGLAVLLALWGLFFDPSVIGAYVKVADEFIPPGAAGILHDQLDALMAAGRTSLGWTTFISFMVATISARAGVESLMGGLNAIHGVRSYSTIFGFVLAYVLTLAIVGVGLLGLATIVIVPLVLNLIPLGGATAWAIAALPWVGLFTIVLIGIGIVYRYGPNVRHPRTALFTWGSLLATVMWAAASIGFSAYLSSFNSYNRIYGSIGAVIALLMWLYLAGFSVLFGAVVNVELARARRLRQTRALRKAAQAAAAAAPAVGAGTVADAPAEEG